MGFFLVQLVKVAEFWKVVFSEETSGPKSFSDVLFNVKCTLLLKNVLARITYIYDILCPELLEPQNLYTTINNIVASLGSCQIYILIFPS